MSHDNSETEASGASKFPWLGPVFFSSVLGAVIIFFVWFLGA